MNPSLHLFYPGSGILPYPYIYAPITMHTFGTEPRPEIQTIALPHDYEEPKVEFGLEGV